MSGSPVLAVGKVLRAEGYSLADIQASGESVQPPELPPAHPNRVDRIRNGTIDAAFDEAVNVWGRPRWRPAPLRPPSGSR
jgi:hypothetical protein